MDIDKIVESITKEWAVMASAPFLFVAALSIVAILIWRVIGAINKGEISGLRAQLGALEERRQLSEDKAHAAVEARKHLEAELEKLRASIQSGASTEQLLNNTASITNASTDLGKLDTALLRILRAGGSPTSNDHS